MREELFAKHLEQNENFTPEEVAETREWLNKIKITGPEEMQDELNRLVAEVISEITDEEIVEELKKKENTNGNSRS